MRTVKKIAPAIKKVQRQPQPFFNKDGAALFRSYHQPFFNKKSIQTKLKVGQPNDKYEKEADSMANKVVNSRQSINTEIPVQRKCEECEKEEKIQKMQGEEEELQMKEVSDKEEIQKKASDEEEKVQMKAEASPDQDSPSLSSRLNSTKGDGNALPRDTRVMMGLSLGADFSSVKIHTDEKAVQMSQQLHAQAFTHGSDIYFNKGKYDPSSSGGKHLLAHELTHVVQQGSSRDKSAVAASGNTVQRSVVTGGKDNECLPGYTICDFIHKSITVEAQYALSHLYRQGGEDCKIALSILGAAENGQLKGVYKEDQSAPALMTRRNGSSWWLLIPKGQRAIVSELESPPMMVFEKRLANDHAALAESLKQAWQKSSLGNQIIMPQPPSMASCEPASKPDQPIDFPIDIIEGVKCPYPQCDPSIPLPCGNANECITVPGQPCGVCEGASKNAKECLAQNEKIKKKERQQCKDEYSPGKTFNYTVECLKTIAECYAEKLGPGKIKACIEAAGCFVDPKPLKEHQECLDKATKRHNEQGKLCKSLP